MYISKVYLLTVKFIHRKFIVLKIIKIEGRKTHCGKNKPNEVNAGDNRRIDGKLTESEKKETPKSFFLNVNK